MKREFSGNDLLKAAELCEAFGTHPVWCNVARDVAAGFSYRLAASRNGYSPHAERARQIIGIITRRAKRIWIAANRHDIISLKLFLASQCGQIPDRKIIRGPRKIRAHS